jgi:hypothetical protein
MGTSEKRQLYQNPLISEHERDQWDSSDSCLNQLERQNWTFLGELIGLINAIAS